MNTIMTSSALDLVSVIITCFNQEKFISKALDSILSQTYQSWECIVVDDGSTDKSEEIIRDYCSLDKRFLYVYQVNAGVSSARNKGFSLAKGNFVQFLDGDDWILSEKLEIQINHFRYNPLIDISYTSHLHYFEQKNLTEKYDTSVIGENPLEDFLYSYDRGISIPIHASLFRRYIWDNNELPFPEEYIHRYEDWVFWITMCMKNKKIGFIDKDLAVYRMHGSNFCNDGFDRANNMLLAANYISRIIPANQCSRFLIETNKHVLNCYLNAFRLNEKIEFIQIKLNRKKYSWLNNFLPDFIKNRFRPS